MPHRVVVHRKTLVGDPRWLPRRAACSFAVAGLGKACRRYYRARMLRSEGVMG